MANRFPGEQPRFDQPVVDQAGRVTQAWANYFLRLASAQSNDDLRALYEALAARVAALEDGEVGSFQILGQQSIAVNGIPQPGHVVIITLQGDEDSPGNTEYYGTGPTGTKGWFPVSGTITVNGGELTKTVGPDGVTTFGLADVADSGTGTLLATTFDAKGRRTGTRPATITGTAQQIDVANGNAAAGLPTLSLAPEVLAALEEAKTALQPGDVAGPNSVKVTPNGSGGIILQLDNDQATPAALTEYSTNSAGQRGWHRPALFESTGVINGAALTINAGNNARFDMAQAVIGYTDWSVTPTQPTRVLLTVGPFTAQVVTNIASANATYVGIQMPGGTIVQQTSPFSNAQRRTIAQIGVLVHSNNVNLNAINDQAATIRAGVNQVGDLMMAVGPLNLTGNVYSANGANLNINKTGGSIFKMGSNFQANNLDPHVVSQSSQTALTFRYRLSNGTEGADTTSINPNQYESSPGVLTNIPILGNQWHVQRISLFQSGQTRIQYGQQLYSSAQAAINGITIDAFNTEQNIAENGILRCYLIINRGLLGLLGSATFAPVSKFGALQASSGATPDHNSLPGLQGGTSGEYYHLTSAQYTQLVEGGAVPFFLANNTNYLVPQNRQALFTLPIEFGTGATMTVDGVLVEVSLMFVLTNTAGASATTPAASKTTLFVDASGVPSTKSSAGTVTPLLTGPAAALAYQPLDADLTGIAGLTYAADKSIYYTGSAWATYDLTGVGRTLLAATTQAAQRIAIGAVGTTGNETIAGVKNCTSIWQWDFGTTIGRIEYGSPGGNPGIVFRARDYSTAANFRSDIRGQPGLVRIGASADSNQPTAAFDITPASIRPTNNNFMSCGEASNAWTQVYAQNTTISTSDARLKTDPRQLSEAERKAGSELARLPAIWEWLTGNRLHAGPTVQAAMAVMAAHELDPFAYSFICYDEWEAEPEQWHEWPAKEAVLDEDGNELEPAIEAGRELIQPAREAGDRYSFRKEELLCFMVAALAAENDVQAAKVEALDARLAALEAKA